MDDPGTALLQSPHGESSPYIGYRKGEVATTSPHSNLPSMPAKTRKPMTPAQLATLMKAAELRVKGKTTTCLLGTVVK